MGSCNCTKKSLEVELEVPPRPKRFLENKFSQDKDLGKDLAPGHSLFSDYDPNDQLKKTLQELYTIVKRCQIILEEYQSYHSGSYPLSLHQISRLICQIDSAFKMNQYWIWFMLEYEEDTIVGNAFNHLRSQFYCLQSKLILISEASEDQQTNKITPKEGHKEMDGKQGRKLKATKYLNFSCSNTRRSQENSSLNLTLTVETLYRLSCNGLSQKIYKDSFENLNDLDFSCWFDFCVKPGEELSVNHGNHKGSTFSKKALKVALPWFKDVTVETDFKSLKSFYKFAAHLSSCNGVKHLELVALNITEIGLYLPQIVKTCARAQKGVCLSRFNFNETQFKKFLMGCRHHEEVDFAWCKFDIPRVPDLSTCMKGTLIKKIWLCFCDKNYELSKYSKTMENLIKGISVCDLKESLREVEILDFTEKGYYNSIFEKYGLGHVVNNSSWSEI
ncbi:unnamed protein product [Moneuplotes crassus]|uniref:Uncharacterized protein n=1 Tax=Euplotes crassus TaxID=5936 RepID=A0AAD1UAM9_EUPCR|nr:unnamed protein product [Moneuplotes crassus]